MKVANVGDGPLGISAQVFSTFLILGLAYTIGRFIDAPWNRWRKKARQTVSKNSSDSTMGFGVSAKAIHPNFLIIKTIAAWCVALSASILIATKSDVNDPLRSTNLTIGVYGLFVLAISSGYLTAESAWRQNDVRNFLIKRFWRIAPAFVVSTLVIAYVVCPFFAQGGKLAFVEDPTVLNVVTKIVFFHTDKFYFPNMAFYQTTQSDDFLPGIANAAIWSIRLQIICYAIIAIFMAMSLFRKRAPLVAMLPFVWLAGLSVIFSDTTTVNWLHLLLFVLPAFCCGAFMNGLARYHKLQGWIAGLASAGLLVAAYWGLLPDVFCFLAAYPIAWLGIHAISPLKKSLAKTDISYGIYLYCWPIAQLTKAGVGSDFGGYEMATMVLPLATAMGWLSWHLVESPALGWGLAQTSPASDEEKKFVPPLGTTKRWIGPDKENR